MQPAVDQSSNRARFRFGKPSDHCVCRLAGKGRLVNFSGANLKRDSCVAQDFRAAR
jgi:hypothetical protein